MNVTELTAQPMTNILDEHLCSGKHPLGTPWAARIACVQFVKLIT